LRNAHVGLEPRTRANNNNNNNNKNHNNHMNNIGNDTPWSV
jgi:hypothetical protein